MSIVNRPRRPRWHRAQESACGSTTTRPANGHSRATAARPPIANARNRRFVQNRQTAPPSRRTPAAIEENTPSRRCVTAKGLRLPRPRRRCPQEKNVTPAMRTALPQRPLLRLRWHRSVTDVFGTTLLKRDGSSIPKTARGAAPTAGRLNAPRNRQDCPTGLILLSAIPTRSPAKEQHNRPPAVATIVRESIITFATETERGSVMPGVAVMPVMVAARENTTAPIYRQPETVESAVGSLRSNASRLVVNRRRRFAQKDQRPPRYRPIVEGIVIGSGMRLR